MNGQHEEDQSKVWHQLKEDQRKVWRQLKEDQGQIEAVPTENQSQHIENQPPNTTAVIECNSIFQTIKSTSFSNAVVEVNNSTTLKSHDASEVRKVFCLFNNMFQI